MRYAQRLDRADRQIALVAFALALAVYLRGVAPDLLTGDPGEFQFAAWRWGLAHPTGYPLYLLLGGAWQRAWGVFGISPAAALNVFSSVTAATAVSLFYLLMRRWFWESPLLGRLAAAWAAFFLAVNPTFWSQALIAEVYALHALFIVIILLTAQGLALSDGRAQLDPRRVAALAFLTGLSLTHHGTTLFIAPGLLVYLTLIDRDWWRQARIWLAGALAFAAPLLLYVYVPLRSGPNASPWYHQPLGNDVLTLYDGSRQAFVDFVTGRAISVGFYSVAEAGAQIGQAAALWRIHFNWAGLALLALGLVVLVWRRNWPVLALTVPYFVLQQIFNLFYAIGDILVYYIPLYLIALIWAGFGAYGLATGVRPIGEGEEEAEAKAEAEAKGEGRDGAGGALGALVLLLLFWLPFGQWSNYGEVIDQSDNRLARAQWNEILAAEPPADAILVSNDRNEIVPLFYLQSVEQRARGLIGLFPLIAPDARFADVVTTIETALDAGGEQPVFLIKEMPGLEVKFALEYAAPPLVQVTGPAAAEAEADVAVDLDYGPLTLLGYDWRAANDEVAATLYWRVDEALTMDYTTTVQLFDADGEKVAQDDRPPGGEFYPTSLWKPGEILADRHVLALPSGAAPTTLLIDMYAGSDFASPAAELRIDLTREK